jgi:demethylmenaquinone methyltransferase/2-methoxy-6-polyprenyl-1,4-benzoquinol methylase
VWNGPVVLLLDLVGVLDRPADALDQLAREVVRLEIGADDSLAIDDGARGPLGGIGHYEYLGHDCLLRWVTSAPSRLNLGRRSKLGKDSAICEPWGVAAAPSARKQQALELFEELPARYDELGAALSFFQDPRWRRAMVAAVGARAEDRVLDVATGTGLVARELVARYGCRVVGLDQSAPMLGRARAKLAADPHLAERIELVTGEAEALPFADAEFDQLTFTYLLRYVDDPAATLRELARVVRPGGRVACLEFCVPRGLWLWPWRLYTRFGLPALGRLASRQWFEVGRFLGPNIEGFYRRLPLERQLELWKEAGIGGVTARRMSLGGGVVIWGTVGG